MAIDFEDAFFKNYMGTMYPMEQEIAPPAPVANTDAAPTTDIGGIAEIPRNKAQEALGYVGQLLTKAGVNLDEYGLDIPVLGRVTLKDLTVGESGRILEDMSYGFMPVTGGGLATKLNPEVLDLVGLPFAGAAAKVVARPIIKATEKIAKALPKDLPVSTSIDLVDGTKQPLEKISKVESKAFKNWFGESKAVDDVGKPIVVYHARRGDFEAFDASKSEGKSGDTGTFFSSSPSVASTYNTSSEHSLVPAYLSLKKPFIVDFDGSNWNRGGSQAVVKLPDGTEDDLLSYFNAASDEFVSTDDVARYAKINGYDGVIIQNVVDHGPAGRFSTEEAFNPSNIYVSFAPTQIKSAISNKGTFDINDPDYLKGIGVGGTSAVMSQEENK